MSGFFRYPGGKSKLRNLISEHLNLYSTKSNLEYREPFFGGGSIGLKFITDNTNWNKIWINDKDSGVACLWTSVIRYPNELKQMIMEFTPSVEAFDEYKSQLLNDNGIYKQKTKIVEQGFKKLAIHQISYSGLGTKSGGPLGGRNQKSKYKIDCRWSPSYICKKVDKLNEQFYSLTFRDEKCTCLNFSDLISCKSDALLYLDPPYFVKGNDLYQHSFTEKDHKQLSECLKISQHPWVLSYDDCPEIRSLYDWAVVESVDVNYSITAVKDKYGNRISQTKPELLVYPSSHKELIDVFRSVLSQTD